MPENHDRKFRTISYPKSGPKHLLVRKHALPILVAGHRAPFIGQNIATLIPPAEYRFLVVLYWYP